MQGQPHRIDESTSAAASVDARAQILVGLGDDAGVYQLGNTTLIETVDVITPVVNDPYTFGAISANNSLSDVYAMGGRPVSALAVAGFPLCEYSTDVLVEIMRGAVSSITRAGAFLTGGHSFDDSEIKFGLSVTGIAQDNKVLTVKGAQQGDLLVLTKPLGIGILTTALKTGKIDDEAVYEAVEWMLTLNDKASAAASSSGASACTDITGFGLLGHAFNMVKGSGVDFKIDFKAVPFMEGVRDFVMKGIAPGGAFANLNFFEPSTDFDSNITYEDKLMLADPQTSGGLLVAVAEEGIGLFENSPLFHRVIGRVVKGSGRIIIG
ncbi:MAG: selenide, water dikinase SelD [Dissulfurispiraceae bacterium]|jgi:selenide,water dikinase|nr:selenide, water dikinase SelD [Dissulfurispiraceae bacterium]